MTSYAEIGERIRKYRKKNNLTIKELGKRIGIAESAMWKYEKGEVKNIDVTMLQNIAKSLNVSLFDLLGESIDDQWGDDEKNIEYLKDNPELLDTYVKLTRTGQMKVLFDKMGKLTPEDVEAVLGVINSIARNRHE